MTNMTGNQVLIAHLENLLLDAKNNNFDDFKSDFATPKIYLVSRLQALIENTKAGKYD